MLMDDTPAPVLEPQPRNGKPFRIHFVNRGDEYWYNERMGFRRGHGPMLISWKCPFGVDGEPVLVGGEWRWQRVGITSKVSRRRPKRLEDRKRVIRRSA